MIVLNWVSEHYSDFDENGEFLDWFEEMLVEDVSMIMLLVLFVIQNLQGKIGEKRILDEARIVNAKCRTIQLVN